MSFKKYNNDDNKADLLLERLDSNFLARNKTKLKLFFSKFKDYIDETKEAKNILVKYQRGEKPNDEELSFLKRNVGDLLKSLGIGTLFILPGGAVLVPLLLKLSTKVGIDLIPSAFKND